MTAKSSSGTRLSKFSRAKPEPSEVDALAAELSGGSDRATAIIIGTFLEDTLEDCLRVRMRPLSTTDSSSLFEGDAPLSRFSAKIRLGFALQIFGPRARRDLDRIRSIRNAAAHARKAFSFSVTEIGNVCLALETINVMTDATPLQLAVPKYRIIANAFVLLHALEADNQRKLTEEQRALFLA